MISFLKICFLRACGASTSSSLVVVVVVGGGEVRDHLLTVQNNLKIKKIDLCHSKITLGGRRHGRT